MCGIVGIVAGRSLKGGSVQLSSMLKNVRHRGPDGVGSWTEDDVWLGHARLSIIDTTPRGAQPMASKCGRYIITYNGEIYNYEALRTRLEEDASVRWVGSSDTEVLLELISRVGVSEALRQCDGMFAFAFWDRYEKVIHLTRDRFGEKPLYYAVVGDGIVFGSELVALEAHSDVPLDLDASAIAFYLRYGYIGAPASIYQSVRKLSPGCHLVFSRSGGPKIRRYWAVENLIHEASLSPLSNDSETTDRLDEALSRSCRRRMVSDVPLGAFLSGGIDSSTIVALMQAQSSRPIRTFTIGFDDPQFNEAPAARLVAKCLGTDHTELILTEADALSSVPQLSTKYDEPFGDSSALPTHLLSVMTKRFVSVVVTGDGGDELFGGYPRHLVAPKLWAVLSRLPCRSLLSGALRMCPAWLFESALYPLRASFSRRSNTPSEHVGGKMLRLAQSVSAPDFRLFYTGLPGVHADNLLTRQFAEHSRPDAYEIANPRIEQQLPWMLGMDILGYLPDDLLTKVDRATMAVGLEGRMPMLDLDVSRIAFQVANGSKTLAGNGKQPLKSVARRYLPQAIVDQPKRGFSLPLRSWLSGPLRGWVNDLLAPSRLSKQGIFDVAAVKRLCHVSRMDNPGEVMKIWTLVMLQSWLDSRSCRTSLATLARADH